MKYVIITFFCLLSAICSAQDYLIESPNDLIMYDIKYDANLQTSYYSGSDLTADRCFILAVDENMGQIKWQYYIEPYNGRPRIQILSNGDLSILVDLDNSPDLLLYKLDSGGNALYANRYNMPIDNATGFITLDDNENLYFNYKLGTGVNNAGVMKVSNSTGNILWQKSYTSQAGYDLQINNGRTNFNGGLYLSGNLGSNEDPAYVELDSAGTILVQNQVHGFSNSYGQVEQVLPLPSGNLLVFALDRISSSNLTDFNPVVFEYNPSLNSVVWNTRVNYVANAFVGNIHVFNNKYYVICSNPERNKNVIIEMDLSGQVLDTWSLDNPSSSTDYNRPKIMNAGGELVFVDNVIVNQAVNIFSKTLSNMSTSCMYLPANLQADNLNLSVSIGALNLIVGSTNFTNQSELENLVSSHFGLNKICDDATSILEENSYELPYNIYPIPSADIFTVEFKKECLFGSVAIYDLSGRLIYKQNVPDFTSNIQLDLSNYDPGVYNLVMNDGRGVVCTEKLVKL